MFAEKLFPPLSNKVRVTDPVQKVFLGLGAQRVQVNETLDEFSAYIDHDRPLLKSRKSRSYRGNLEPGSPHELYAWSDGATGRLFGHYDASGAFVVNRLGGHLP